MTPDPSWGRYVPFQEQLRIEGKGEHERHVREQRALRERQREAARSQEVERRRLAEAQFAERALLRERKEEEVKLRRFLDLEEREALAERSRVERQRRAEEDRQRLEQSLDSCWRLRVDTDVWSSPAQEPSREEDYRLELQRMHTQSEKEFRLLQAAEARQLERTTRAEQMRLGQDSKVKLEQVRLEQDQRRLQEHTKKLKDKEQFVRKYEIRREQRKQKEEQDEAEKVMSFQEESRSRFQRELAEVKIREDRLLADSERERLLLEERDLRERNKVLQQRELMLERARADMQEQLRKEEVERVSTSAKSQRILDIERRQLQAERDRADRERQRELEMLAQPPRRDRSRFDYTEEAFPRWKAVPSPGHASCRARLHVGE